jgi:hypothetical protein
MTGAVALECEAADSAWHTGWRVAGTSLTPQRHVLPVSIFDNKLDRESINP